MVGVLIMILMSVNVEGIWPCEYVSSCLLELC